MKLKQAKDNAVVLELTPNELDALWRIAATVAARYEDLDHTVFELARETAEAASETLEPLVQQAAGA